MLKLCKVILVSALLSISPIAISQQDGGTNSEGQWQGQWKGQWRAEGTLFQVAITVQGNVIAVNEVESLGFVWFSGEGQIDGIDGRVARIPVQYAGVNGVVRVELVNNDTAVAVAASCMPEFMVVCALAKGRQAVFRRVPID